MSDTKHGGSREGSGRPAVPAIDGNRVRTTITLGSRDLDWLLNFAVSRGLSGVSAAVRQLIEDRKIGTI